MSDFCQKCHRYLYGNQKECNCKEFTVINEDGEEYEVHATDERSAALSYAESSNVEGEYYLMNECVEIEINGTKYAISAEPDVHYSASKIHK